MDRGDRPSPHWPGSSSSVGQQLYLLPGQLPNCPTWCWLSWKEAPGHDLSKQTSPESVCTFDPQTLVHRENIFHRLLPHLLFLAIFVASVYTANQAICKELIQLNTRMTEVTNVKFFFSVLLLVLRLRW